MVCVLKTCPATQKQCSYDEGKATVTFFQHLYPQFYSKGIKTKTSKKTVCRNRLVFALALLLFIS